jgi:hypothetical protein
VRAIRKFLALAWKDRFLLLEAGLYLGAARAALLIVPFRHIAPHLGRQWGPEQPRSVDAPAGSGARQIGWAVETMGRRTPWDSTCLAQSMAGKFMLANRGLSSLLYLGTKRDAAGKFTAHAWLRAGNEILVGGAGHEAFTVLSIFGDALS